MCFNSSSKIKQLILSLCIILPVQGQDFSVGWELWYPYQFHDKQNQLTGIDIEIFNLIAKQAEMEISYVELPWQRHLMYIKSGKIDVAFGASYTKERAKTAYYSLPYRKELVNLFVLKGTSELIKLAELSDISKGNYLIGVENGYFYGERYEKLQKNAKFMARIHGVLDIEQNVKMLLKKHIDGFLADPVAMQSFVDKYKLQNEFEIHPLEIYQSDIHIMLSKKSCNEEDLSKVNVAINTLRKSGKLTNIINRWSISH